MTITRDQLLASLLAERYAPLPPHQPAPVERVGPGPTAAAAAHHQALTEIAELGRRRASRQGSHREQPRKATR